MGAGDDRNSGPNLVHGFEVAVGVGLGYLAGTWFDKRYHTAPWGLYVAIMLGCAAGMYQLIRDSIRSNKD
jgi:F0F1-type ATP synthase assembly protein I